MGLIKEQPLAALNDCWESTTRESTVADRNNKNDGSQSKLRTTLVFLFATITLRVAMDQKESNAKKNGSMGDDEKGKEPPKQHSAAATRNTTLLDSKLNDTVDDGDNDEESSLSWDCQAAPPTTPPTMAAKVTIGAQRVSGIYGHDSSVEMADFEEYDTESVAAVATVTSATSFWQAQASMASPPSLISAISDESSYLVEATTVPELVSARAIPMPPISEDEHQDDKESIHDQDTVVKGDSSFCRQRRGLFLAIALLVVVIVALALGVALGQDIPEHTTTANNNDNNNNNQSNSTTTRGQGNSTNIFLHHAPTTSPTANNNVQIFLTTLNARRCDSGYMFDITAKTNLDILALQINMQTQTSQPIEVWTKSGPYHGFETNQSSWTLLAQTNVTPSAMRTNNLVPLPRNLFSPISMTNGSQLALYITARDKVICFQVSLKSLVGVVSYESVAYNTTDFDLHVGAGVSYRFDGFGRPSIWSGILEYERTGN